MCFSPLASFTTAAVTGLIGVASLSRVSRPGEIPLAAMPVLFAAQQAVEGLLWLVLPDAPDGVAARALTSIFLALAMPFWPVFAPIAAFMIEPDSARRRMMAPCLVMGACVSAYLLFALGAGPHHALIRDGHIVYETAVGHSLAIGVAYVAAVSLALMLSSQRAVAALGVVVLFGSAIAYFVYWEAFLSVWCFFAAGASAIILWRFEHVRQVRLRLPA